VRRVIRRHFTYANVMASIAVFVALGGTGYGALRVGSGDIVDNSVRGKDIRDRTVASRDVRRNGLGGASIKEARLGRVPRARRADLLGGVSASDLRLRCPDQTKFISGVCIERQFRPPVAYGIAAVQCESVQRRLPLHHELMAIVSDDDVALADGGELTAHVYPSADLPGRVDALTVTSKVGAVGVTPDTAAGAKAFRCVAYPSN
jgi:hypothetical protein